MSSSMCNCDSNTKDILNIQKGGVGGGSGSETTILKPYKNKKKQHYLQIFTNNIIFFKKPPIFTSINLNHFDSPPLPTFSKIRNN